MADTRDKYKLNFYKCGRCKGNIRYLKTDKKPDICPQCGYGHGTVPVNSIPNILKLNLNEL